MKPYIHRVPHPGSFWAYSFLEVSEFNDTQNSPVMGDWVLEDNRYSINLQKDICAFWNIIVSEEFAGYFI